MALALVAALVVSSSLEHGFEYATGLLCLFFGALSFFWYLWHNKGREIKDYLRRLDWQTGVFLIGIFVLVESLAVVGLMEDLAGYILAAAGSRPFAVYALIVGVSVLLSAFIDNVPSSWPCCRSAA